MENARRLANVDPVNEVEELLQPLTSLELENIAGGGVTENNF